MPAITAPADLLQAMAKFVACRLLASAGVPCARPGKRAGSFWPREERKDDARLAASMFKHRTDLRDRSTVCVCSPDRINADRVHAVPHREVDAVTVFIRERQRHL